MTRTLLTCVIATFLALGCASAPETRPEQNSLEAQAAATVASMTREDPSLGEMLSNAAGYVVFPEVGEAGFIASGSAGVGVVYEDGAPIGFAELREGSVGAQVGGQTFSQLIVFESQSALDRLKSNNFDLTADTSATAITSGAAASVQFEDGAAVFIEDEAGLMVEAAVGGQSITFVPG